MSNFYQILYLIHVMIPLKVAISCVGSGIGQSIIESINLSKLPIHSIGFDCSPLAYGLYETNSFQLVPKISDPDYVSSLVDFCDELKADILIPASDDELLLISSHKERFEKIGTRVILAPYELVELCRKKDLASNLKGELSGLFVRSFTPKQAIKLVDLDELAFPLLAKPRSGSGSQGIKIIHSAAELELLDSSFIIQEIALPPKSDPNYRPYMSRLRRGMNSQIAEISIQLVFDKSSRLLGRMTTYNKLKNGVPIEVQPYERSEIWESIQPLHDYFQSKGFTGPLNIQGRLTDGGLKLFEMNARFTGISGLRAHFGFNEVEACIIDIMGEKPPKLAYNQNYFGIRQTTKKRVHYSINPRPELDKVLKPPTILISGANGYLGLSLLDELSGRGEMDILALVRQKDTSLIDRYPNVHFYSVDEFRDGKLNFGLADCFIHTAFARPFKGAAEIAESVKFTSELFKLASSFETRAIINISSQSVYGDIPGEKTELSDVNPTTIYGMAKYSTEVILSELCHKQPQINFTSLRLASLCGPSAVIKPVDILSKLVGKVKNGQDILIDAPDLLMERLDVRDAAAAIAELALNPYKPWNSVYNLGNPSKFTLKELATRIVDIGRTKFNMNGISLVFEKLKTSEFSGMNSTLLIKHTNWEPRISADKTIEDLFATDF